MDEAFTLTSNRNICPFARARRGDRKTMIDKKGKKKGKDIESLQKDFASLKENYSAVINDWKFHKDEYYEYLVEFLRFEYIRRNAEYKKDWENLKQDPHVKVLDDGQAEVLIIIRGSESINQIVKTKKGLIEFKTKWYIPFPCDPSMQLPKKKIPNKVSQQKSHGMIVDIYKNDEIIESWVWKEIYDSLSGKTITKKGEKYALEFDNNETIVSPEVFNSMNHNSKPQALILKESKERIDLRKFHQPPYSITINPLINFTPNNTHDNYSAIKKTIIEIVPNMLQNIPHKNSEYIEMERVISGIEKPFFDIITNDDNSVSVNWDDDWQLVAIRKNAKQEETINQLKAMGVIYERNKTNSKSSDKNPNTKINFLSFLDHLIIWDLYKVKSYKQSVIAESRSIQNHNNSLEDVVDVSPASISRIIKDVENKINGEFKNL